MNFLEKIWRITDDIFQWRIWHILKWATGAVIAGGIIYLLILNPSNESIFSALHHYLHFQ